ncbi:LuxR C-terminal-related transcriptional regulator [Patulibacter minatonensis]|uniref:LuxR C-terminal-related transcriptional regulator n=1 Tax=Patulibacter minatonensis TaxID=298163 RepID=UPI0004797EE9|nr:LuxR C-terminal-related transcriptional regulator [Patulibacter minatonensis]
MSTPEHVGRTEPHVLAAVERLARRAADRGLATADVPRPPRAPDALALVQGLARDAGARMAEGSGRSDDAAIAMDALDLERELRHHGAVRRARRRAAQEDAVERLMAIADPATLLRRVADEAVLAGGMRRALFSRVGDDAWSPVSWSSGASDRQDPDEPTVPLDRMPLEFEVVRTRRPLLVTDADADARVHRRIRGVMDRSFAVVPVAPDDRVIGLLHVDRDGEDRDVDEGDRDLLWAFAEGFGRLYERAALRYRLGAQRAIVEATARAALKAVPELSETIELARPVDLRYRARDPLEDRPVDDALLTPREREVADLMAAGLTNAAIGRKLVVEPATVKSHMRIILRKLGATNRAQAVALYLRRDVPGSSPRDRR